MARPKYQSPILKIARSYLQQHAPDMSAATLRMRQLDGPPGSPRFAVIAERCTADICIHHHSPEFAAAGRCNERACERRRSVHLLINRDGTIVQMIDCAHHWE